MLVRALIPVFGTAYSNDPNDPLRLWYLEYGPGRDPTDWTRIKESQTPQRTDPYAAGKVVWDPNWGAHGNLADWSVGLQGYRYARWRQNLNGLYTLRLVAETRSGERSETRVTVYVGEAIIRVNGGTAISADGACRVSVPSFAFGDGDARVVVVLKQIPSFDLPLSPEAGPTDEIGGTADAIYSSLGREFRPLSAIYRILPSGLKADPAITVQIDASAPPAPDGDTGLYQWNPVVKRWMPLPTDWAGSTAQSTLHHLSEYESYMAVLQRVSKDVPIDAEWRAKSALAGTWVGFTEPMSVVRVRRGGRGDFKETRADENGYFSLPYLLSPSVGIYAIEAATPDGTRLIGQTSKRQQAGPVVMARAPRLTTPLSSELSDTSATYFVCEDNSLADAAATVPRSIIINARNTNFSKTFDVELAESVPGSGRFIGELHAGDPSSPYYGDLQALRPGEVITFTTGTSTLHLTVVKKSPPEVALNSPTHPSFFYASGNAPWPPALVGTRNHSEASVEWTNDGWKISGASDRPSARVVHWTIPSVNVDHWPIIAFSYRSMDAQNWQLLLRSERAIHTLNLGKADSWFRAFAKTTPLENRNEWIRWQQNLTGGPATTIGQISFGSWVKGAFMEARPAFANQSTETLWIKDLWIGRTYNEPAVQMDWNIKETAPLRSIEWWVNQAPESRTPAPNDIQARIDTRPKAVDSCRFTVPESGTWYFHLRATDTSGFSNPPTSYPLSIVFSRRSSLRAAQGGEAELVQWEQPRGTFRVPLGDLAPALSVKTLRMVVEDREYPLSKATIDYNTGELLVSAESFDDTAPLGINGESITASFSGNDLNGRALDRIAQVQLSIRSPFREEQTEQGIRLQVADKATDGGRPWFTFWRSPHAPWMEGFPGSVNNSLIFFQGADKKNETPPVRWERPISIVASTDQRTIWVESMETPWGRPNSPTDIKDLPRVDHRGGEIRNASLMAQWVEMITPETPFGPDHVRVAIATRGSGLRLIRTTTKGAIDLLKRQTDRQTLRLDGWVPPTGSPVVIVLPKDASVDYAVGGMTSFTRLATVSLRIEPSGEWQRFALILRAPTKTITNQTIRIHGTPYW